ncbi:type II toxin-antitoxin system RelE/ParE family toxin [Pseudoduganella sp. LjRoot289]|uniref:type II toxin-antitoxin system RelE/ParE family toxin n=1 Tax=Pseudoduganella sp. LjRoot289 TaxID=3342314 RepID=UPI003ECEE1E0
MTTIVLMPQAKDDLEEIFNYLAQFSVGDSAAKIAVLRDKLKILEQAPLLGRPIPNSKRELLIGKRRHVYVVQYQFNQAHDIVHITSIRNGRLSSRN